MLQYERFVHPEDFEGDLSTRLRIGELAVDQIVTMRMELPTLNKRFMRAETVSLKYAQFVIRITDLASVGHGSTKINYTEDLTNISENTVVITQFLNPDSIILYDPKNGRDALYRMYLIDNNSPDWDINEIQKMLGPRQ